MDIEGKIILDLGITSGTSKAGNLWKKREVVLETFGAYPRKAAFTIFGDRVDSLPVEVGKNYVVSFDIESREWNGRWFTDLRVFAVREVGEPAPAQQTYTQPAPAFQQPAASAPAFQQPAAPAMDPLGASNESDDLPF